MQGNVDQGVEIFEQTRKLILYPVDLCHILSWSWVLFIVEDNIQSTHLLEFLKSCLF